jgi:hypothetical protein
MHNDKLSKHISDNIFDDGNKDEEYIEMRQSDYGAFVSFNNKVRNFYDTYAYRKHMK